MLWKNRGFTLAEMAVVVMIAGLIMAITAPGLVRYLNQSRVRDSAGVLRNEMRLARQKAVTNGTRNYVYFQYGTNYNQYWTAVATQNPITHVWSARQWRGPIDLPSKTKQIGANFSSYIYFYYDPYGKGRQPLGMAWPAVDPPSSGSVRIVSTVPSITDTVTVNLDLSGSVW